LYFLPGEVPPPDDQFTTVARIIKIHIKGAIFGVMP